MKLGFLRSRNYEHEPGFELQRSKMKKLIEQRFATMVGYRERRCGASLNEGANGVFIPKRDLGGQDITSYGYCLEVVSNGWSFVSAILGQMTYSIASSTLDSAWSYVMQVILIVVVVDDVSFILKLLVLVGPVFLLGLLALAIVAACAFRAEEMPSVISCWMAAKVMAGVSDVDVLLGGILST
ncbi:hypothetical protein Tco_0820737 [Tanacetum coccineum]|uniref:Uncharacterized protein n=1 Tax=Tanacetum coccineum TaxID=301880 RepID=A0ABQ5AEF6_9ASTR